MKRLVLTLLLLSLVTTGCIYTTRYYNVDIVPPLVNKLESGQIVYIALPRDGVYESTVYEGSGKQALSALRTNLEPHAATVFTSSRYEDDMAALGEAKMKNARYVFVPLITHWEHRVAAWSGRPSVVSLQITVYDLARAGNDKRIMQRDIQGTGRMATWRSQYPVEILNPLVERFVEDIFSK